MEALDGLVVTEREGNLCAAVREAYGAVNYGGALVAYFDLCLHSLGNVVGVYLKLNGSVVNVGSDAYFLYVVDAHCLKPYGLPDTAHGSVPASEILGTEALLSAGLLGIKSVLAHNGEVVLLLSVALYVIGDIELKGGVAALVRAEILTVKPYLGDIVCGAEVKKNSLAFKLCGHGNGAVIPDII